MTPRRLDAILKIAAELLLEDAVLVAQLLLLPECHGVFGLLPARTFWPVHAGAVVFAFKRFRGAKSATPKRRLMLDLGPV